MRQGLASGMKPVRRTGQFEKDLRLAHRRGCRVDELAAIIDKLRAGEPLPAKNRDHSLSGEWKHHRECHIRPDWLLIYQDLGNELVLVRTGTHSDLFE